jgi:hypothetical protein
LKERRGARTDDINGGGHYVTKERKLWLHVLDQAVAEARGENLWGVPLRERGKAIKRARRWLSTWSENLMIVGFHAGLEYDQIRLLVQIYKEKYGRKSEKTPA